MEGLGQLANHTCCDIHWNANLEVAAIEHYEETEILCFPCTNNTENTTIPPATADMIAINDTVSITDYTPRERQDLEMPDHELNQDHSARNKQEYPESEIDDWDWDELKASPFKGTTTPIQLSTKLLPPKNQGAEGGIRQDDYPGSGGGHPGLGSFRTPPGQRHKNQTEQYKPTTLKPRM